jgi:hypothetical protein
MESNEFRIGNYCSLNHKIVKVEAITSEIISVSGLDENRFTPVKVSELSPIQLTKELLFLNGFVKRGMYNSSAIFIMDYNIHKEIRCISIIQCNGCFEAQESHARLENLHHLQNYYHSLLWIEFPIKNN